MNSLPEIALIMEKMIERNKGELHDIEHFTHVWTYARTIGILEWLDELSQYILEVSAITHDIACPLCRIRYGSSAAKYQEVEGLTMVQDFLNELDMPEDIISRIKYIVGHHHTYSFIDGTDFQILVEADYIVNAMEKQYPEDNIRQFREKVMKTESGKRILASVFDLRC